jgi:carbon monoxide dehydrogenase subunit G
MRLAESIVVSAPPKLVWEFISDPDNTLRYMSGVTRWEVEGDIRSGLGARYRMLMRVGSAEMGGLVEVVEFSEPLDMAWSSVTGVDQRGRWRLRRAGGGRTKVEFRFAYGVAGAGIAGYISERVAAPLIRGHLRRSLQQLRREVQHEHLRQQAAAREAERSPA